MALDDPCTPWEIDGSCCPSWLPANTSAPSPDPDGIAARLTAQLFASRWASAFLWKRSRRRVGICTNTVSFCPPHCHCTPCRCGPSHVLELTTDVPVVEITEIRNVCAGAIIDPARYAIVNGTGVGLIDQTCGWMPGTPFDCALEIDYLFGWEPDAEALLAAGALACAFVETCLDVNCKSGEFLKLTAGFYKRGKRDLVLTGVPLTDHWLIEINRGGTSGMLDPSIDLGYSLS